MTKRLVVLKGQSGSFSPPLMIPELLEEIHVALLPKTFDFSHTPNEDDFDEVSIFKRTDEGHIVGDCLAVIYIFVGVVLCE